MNSICQDCGKTFNNKHNLAVHRQNHTKDEVKCHICEKICIGRKKFQNHIKLHQNFECANCGESIKMNSKTSHTKKCEGDKTVFNCKFCPYVNNRMDRLRKHTSQKHERKEDVFSCNFCEFNTTITLCYVS